MVTGGASVTAVAAAGPGAAPAPAGGCVPSGTDSALPAPRRSSENRRSNKPIMEKRRRARINNCLNELKSLILDAMKKDPARHSKLEKADILEMTVKHLETLQRQQAAMAAAADPAVVNKFRAGFNECTVEVGRFPGLDSAVRRRLLQHLHSCINGNAATSSAEPAASPASPPAGAAPASPPTTAPAAPSSVQVHILQSGTGGSLPTLATANGGIFLTTNGAGPSLQLVPTRLPNGDIALVLPSASSAYRQTSTATNTSSSGSSSSPSTSPVPSSTSSTASSPLPQLIPVPQRTASTASASSTASSSSSASSASPVAFDRLSVTSPPAMASPPAPPTPTAPAPRPLSPPSVRDAATSPSTIGPIFRPRSPPRRSPSPYEIPPRPYSPPMQKPLSLVIRKTSDACSDDEKPWRPW